jgi:lipopolysaccharide transport system permease protein
VASAIGESVYPQTGRGESASPPAIIIEPEKGWVGFRLRELWAYRELLYFLTWREVKVRYQQTAIGAAWALIQPLFTMLVFSLFFGRLAKMPSDGIPYPVFSLTGLVPWTFFSNGLSNAANSLVSNSNLVSKVYFPRLSVPISSILCGLVDFALAFAMLLGLMIIHRVPVSGHVVWLPAFLLLSIGTSLGVGLWLSALNVEYRDVRYVVPFLIQFWMFATPVAYPSSLLKTEPWRSLYGINPMVGVVEGFRWALLGTGRAPGAMLAFSVAISVLLLLGGAYYFRRMEKNFADVI